MCLGEGLPAQLWLWYQSKLAHYNGVIFHAALCFNVKIMLRPSQYAAV